MFENSGSKIRRIAIVTFALTVVGAAITVLVGVLAGGAVGFLTGLLSAAITVFAGWVSAVSLCALADAAEFSEEAAHNSREILKSLQRMGSGESQSNPAAGKNAVAPAHTSAPSVGGYDANRIPAWKRVQMEQENKQ